MSDPSDQVIADARAAYQRITGRDDPADYAVRRRRAGKGKLGQRIARIAIADAAILVAAVVVGMVWPLGLFGAEVRKLVGEQLPDFIRDYQNVPANLRGVARNGQTPDGQLVEGLGVIDREIAQVSEQLAQGDLDGLATRARFLEIKYKGDDAA